MKKRTNNEIYHSEKNKTMTKKQKTRYFGQDDSAKTVLNPKVVEITPIIHRTLPRKKNTNLLHKEKNERYIKKNKKDPFPDVIDVPLEIVSKYKRGKIENTRTKHPVKSSGLKLEKQNLEAAAKQAAKSELILHENAGILVAEEGEHTTDVTQYDLKDSVDVTSAQKSFELELKQFGPYRMNYTRNGRFLLVAGQRGHVASIDWVTKKLMCEMNVMETANDVKWLHQETMFAVAQKRWTYIYDNQGIELHCLKMLDCVLRLEFLPHHFLLASANSKGYLSWIDVSIGKQIAGHNTRCGRLDVMAQNPANGIICLGHPGGKLSMWSPNVKEPLVKMLVHGSSTRSIAVDDSGKFMATSGVDRTVKIWDLRTYRMLESFKVGAGASSLSFSQRGLLAAGIGNIVEVYKDCGSTKASTPYINHRFQSSVTSVQFCPYEDVLGAGHSNGFTSLLVPGAGEPNFDALEANPYQTKSQRKQAEVQMLLDKIQPEMIHLESSKISQLEAISAQEQQEAASKVLNFKPEIRDFTPKYKKKGRSKIGNLQKRKTAVHEADLRASVKKRKSGHQKSDMKTSDTKPSSVLDRFVKKS